MGINYYQHAIIGIEIKAENCKQVISPSVYEEQARYDTKTGQQTHTEQVLVKQEEYKFVGFGVEHTEFNEFLSLIASKLDLDLVYIDEDTGYVGELIGDEEDFGRTTLLYGEYSLQKLQNIFQNVQHSIDGQISLYLEPYIG